MSLQFYFGPSGVGKSTQLYTEIIERAKNNPKTNFLVIVPDQFTMQTQETLVKLHERGGIMNIDVLSFGRLGHRIFEEVGKKDTPVLDDTGKCLVLQKVASNLKEQLPTLGSFLHKQGYIHEVKSAISEFMQYGIGTQDVSKLIEHAKPRGVLACKLRDLEVLYKGFMDYIHGNYITTEETLDVLRNSLAKSKILQGSVVVFDGFTGFTPIQNRLIQELMRLCQEIIVTVTIGEQEDPYTLDGEQKLFHLSKKTVADLQKLAAEIGVERKEDVFIRFAEKERHRFEQAPALQTLENSLFRYGYQPYEGEQEEIRLLETTTPKEEVHQMALEIRTLVQEMGIAYRDIAVIVGDLESYTPFVEGEFAQLDIPCFIDRTRGIVLNPMIEYIKSALALYLQDFSYEAVFHYLRSGLVDIERDDIDLLENYIIRTGIRGKKKWSNLFTSKKGEGEEALAELAKINDIRACFMEGVASLAPDKQMQAKDYVNKLYDFLVKNEVQQKLAYWENFFLENNQASRAKEYGQIYRLVMELLEQVYQLLGEEQISLQEFADILEAGFGEIEVGIIPQNVDRVVVGDMERTRLKQVKVLFFLGINDGNIPKNTSKGGILSDIDREFLQESELELAPTPRQQMYIQRFYLYLNMTKPSHRLYLSYSKMNSAGKALRPAYLIDVVKKIFPCLQEEFPQNRPILDQIVSKEEGLPYLAGMLREYAQNGVTGADASAGELFTVYQAYETDIEKRERLTQAAFRRYEDSGLSKAVARALYGMNLENSVSRLETYAACAYHHFLQYGLSLREREEFGFESVDMGNVYHGVL